MSLSWVTVVWSATASACLTLALVHLGIWFKQPGQRTHIVLSVIAVSVAVIAACELLLMRAETPEQFGTVLRWAHVPVFVAVISVVVFVRLFFQAGSLWLAGGACGFRLLALILNFYFEPNLNYRDITGLLPLQMPGGEFVSTAVGTHNPWVRIGELSSLMLLLFVIDASVALWRRGGRIERRRAVIVGGSFALFVVIAAGSSALMHAGIIQIPYLISTPFLAIVAAMGYELSSDVVRAAQLSRQLQASEAELRQHKQRSDHAAAAARMGIWEWDVGSDEIWLTEQARDLFGFAPEERINLDRYLSAVHREDQDAVRRVVTHLRQYGGSYDDLEYRVLSATGSMRWIATRGRVEVDVGGKPVVMHGVSLDITRRKEMESKLQESEARFRTVANTSPVMIWMAGSDKLCTFFNNGWLAFTGRSIEQELGNGWAEGVHREDLARCLDTYAKAVDARQGFSMEYRLRRFDGEYRWVLDRGIPLPDPDGAFDGYIGTAVDITELKRSEENFRLAVEASPSAMVMIDAQGAIVMVNQQTEKTFGYARNELLGLSIEVLVPDRYRAGHPRHRPAYIAEPQARAMAGGREVFGRRKNGSEVAVEIGLNPVHAQSGMFVLASIIDITQRKRAEKESAEQRNELAHLSRVTMLGELSGSLAHELNQPLTAILSNAQAAQRFLARDDCDLDEVRDILKDIVSDDKRAGEVIHGLRRLLTKGETPYQPLDLNEVVSDVLVLVRSDLLNNGIGVTTDLAPALPAVNGDRVQLQQVLLNLVVNGCEAMSGVTGADRHLVVRTALAEDACVCVSVADEGGGIPPHDLERVFEPFFTTKAQGLGLGLAVCRTIISAQGGHLWATNNPDRGASFHFKLPVHAAGPM